MGRTTETIEISVSVSNHNSEQDVIDRESLDRLRWMIRKDISEIQQDNESITITTMGCE